MEEPISPRKANKINNFTQPQQEIFLPEEKEQISTLIYEEKNQEFIKLFEDYLLYSKSSNPKLDITIAKIKAFLTKRKSFINTLDTNYNSVNFLLSHLKEMYSFEKYHFVELFIFFYEFISYDENEREYLIDKKNFLMVNHCLFNIMIKNVNNSGNEEDFEKKMLKDIFKYLKRNEKLNLYNLIYYLKQLAESEITEENLFKILDKGDNGSVKEKEVREMIRGVEEFIVLCDESSRSHSSLDNCTYIVDNLFTNSETLDEDELNEIIQADNSFVNFLKKILKEAEEVIMKMIPMKTPAEIMNLLRGKKNLDEVQNESNSNNEEFEEEEMEHEEDEFEGEENTFFNNNLKENSPVLNIGEDTLRKLPYINLSSEKILSFGSNNNILNSNKTERLNDDTVVDYNVSTLRDQSEQAEKINTRTYSNPEKDFARKISFGSNGNGQGNDQDNKRGSNAHSNKDAGNIFHSEHYKNIDLLRKLNSNISPIVTCQYNNNKSGSDARENSKDSQNSKEKVEANKNYENINDNEENLKKNILHVNINDNHAFDFLGKESDDPLVKQFFDFERFKKIEKIKIDSCLYDISISDFLKEIFTLQKLNLFKINETISKENFIHMLLNIINKYTHELHLYSRIKSLDDFYDILSNYDLTQEISYLEVLGSILLLCKGESDDKIMAILDFLKFDQESGDFKTKFILILSGVLKLILKISNKEHKKKLDSKIIAEILYEAMLYKYTEDEYSNVEDHSKFTLQHFSKFFDLNEENPYDDKKEEEYLLKNNLIFESSETLNKNLDGVPPVHKENTSSEENFKLKIENEIFSRILQNLERINNMLNISEVSLIDAIDLIKKKSLIGYINKPQFIESINIILDEFERNSTIKLSEDEKTEKILMITEILNINSNNTQLFELVEIMSPLIVILKGTAEEKAVSIFKIFEKDVDDCLNYGELFSFLYQIFYFILNQCQLNVDEISTFCENLVKTIVEGIFSNFKLNLSDGLRMKQLLEYYFLLI